MPYYFIHFIFLCNLTIFTMLVLYDFNLLNTHIFIPHLIAVFRESYYPTTIERSIRQCSSSPNIVNHSVRE